MAVVVLFKDVWQKLNEKLGSRRRRGGFLGPQKMTREVREFHTAVATNNKALVIQLIEEGVNINFAWYTNSGIHQKNGATPLLVAVSLNHTEIIELLLQAGAYINKCDGLGCTPLFKAAFHGRSSLIELLTKSGADVNLPDFAGKTPLFICAQNRVACSRGLSAIKSLIAAGAQVDKCDNTGRAPIHAAAVWKQADVVHLLIAAKCNVNPFDIEGCTPLYLCVRLLSTTLYREEILRQLPIVIQLLMAGADKLNLVQWLLQKGPGLNWEMLQDEPFGTYIWNWYKVESRRPLSLKNICRKSLQMLFEGKKQSMPKSDREGITLTGMCQQLPLPSHLMKFVMRRMFFTPKDAISYPQQFQKKDILNNIYYGN